MTVDGCVFLHVTVAVSGGTGQAAGAAQQPVRRMATGAEVTAGKTGFRAGCQVD